MVERLLESDYKVIVMDDLSTGKIKNLNTAAVFHHTDITQPAMAEIIQREEPDLVFHMAAQTSVNQSTKDPIGDTNANVVGTLRVLEACRRPSAGRRDRVRDATRCPSGARAAALARVPSPPARRRSGTGPAGGRPPVRSP